MSDNKNDGLKKVLYAGVGLAAASAEAVGKAVDSLAAKGEETVQKNKDMNEELKRKKEAAKEAVKDVAEALEKMTKDELEVIRKKLAEIEKSIKQAGKKKMDAETFADNLKDMSPEELDAIKAKLDEIRMNWTDEDDKGAEN